MSTPVLRRFRPAAAVLGLVLSACTAGSSAEHSARPVSTASAMSRSAAAATTPAPPTPAAGGTSVLPRELPLGGRQLLPRYRLVGFAGNPDAPALGALGVGPLRTKGAQIGARARAYAALTEHPTLPVFELIVSVVHRGAGADGMYRSHVDDAMIARHLAAARAAKGLLLLDIQAGRADFIDEVKYFDTWLAQPDVGVALDPEWAIDDGELPGQVYGHTTGSELDVVATYLAAVTRLHRLPEKVLVFHQVAPQVVRDPQRLHAHKGIVIIRSVDGIGSPGAKRATYATLVRHSPAWLHTGFKLFFTEDIAMGRRLMTPKEVLALRPQPVYVMYE